MVSSGPLRPDLLVALDREDRRPLRVQLEEQLRDGVRDGRCTPAPPCRRRARWRQSSASPAAWWSRPTGSSSPRASSWRAADRHARREGRARRRRPDGRAVARIPSVRFDLRPESAERGAFPRRPWLAAMRRALDAAPDADLGYGSRAGAPGLRSSLAAYLGRARGVVAAPEDIVVSAGITQAIALLAGLLRSRGARRVIVEEPGFWQHRTNRIAPGSSRSPSTSTPAGFAPRRCRPAPPRWSPRRTSTPPARSSRPSGGPRCSTGRPRTTPS